MREPTVVHSVIVTHTVDLIERCANQVISTSHRILWCYCIVPWCSVAFWTHSEIIPVGQFFRRWIKSINQAQTFIADFSVDWLIDDKLTLTWLVYWIRTARSFFTGAGLKWPNTGTTQYCFSWEGKFEADTRFDVEQSQRADPDKFLLWHRNHHGTTWTFGWLFNGLQEELCHFSMA